ncbi:MAG: filamentous hemagglutinin N-terminal domain-containing protein [Chlamydiota bacterium]
MRIRPLICVWMICVHFAAWGNPQNPTVVSGEATFGAGTNALDIIASDHAIIEWEAFSIGQGEKTNFMLPSSDSAVLNRVTSHLPSSLEGLLNSNGKVYLINPNGVLVTESGIIKNIIEQL